MSDRKPLISEGELWLGIEVVFYILIFSIWDMFMVHMGADPATRSMMANALGAVGIVFGRRLILQRDRITALEEKAQE